MIHILREGRTLCEAVGQIPGDGDGGEFTWVAFNDPHHMHEVDCWRCICLQVGKEIPDVPKTPMHDRVRASGDLPTQLCEFVLEFLSEKGYHLGKTHTHDRDCYEYPNEKDENMRSFTVAQCGMRDGQLISAALGDNGTTALAAEFIGVDKKKYDQEKDDSLAYIREMNKLEAWAMSEGRQMLAPPRPRCNKGVRRRSPLGVYLCDEDPGHGGKCDSKFLRTKV